MIHLYTGEGKGKTTAAIGQAMRAAGSGYLVVFAQFMKGNDTGELHSLAAIPEVQFLRSEKSFGFYSAMNDDQKAELTQIHNGMLNTLLARAEEGETFLMVLDEITYPVNWNLLDVERLKDLLSYARSSQMEIVLTGRDPAQFLQDSADYITRMECVRHPYKRGIEARKGVEF